ncbi:MAG: hypothetical protein LBR23_05805 [Spirochaetaceae bacterium]|jgi:hypothetical protein|nr:hypothetical protein [Spirochaetaceae bacterium]
MRKLTWCAALVIAAVFVGGCDGIYTLRDYLDDRAFVPIADITGIPSGAVMGSPLTLSPVIVPDNATKKTVAWSVSDPGTARAAITGGVFRAAAVGTAVITARVADGLWRGKDFVKAFTITVGVDSIDVAMTASTSRTLWSYDSDTKVITLQDGAFVTLYGSTAQNRVAVESGAAVRVTLDDVTIDLSDAGGCAFDIENDATVTILLSGTNTLTSGGGAAGVHVTTGRSLVIDSAASAGAGTPTSSHAETGSLSARGGQTNGAGAGIGGSIAEPGGTITIAGGTVTAYASDVGSTWQGGAAIGGGGEWDAVGDKNGANHAGTILISGGVVNAVGVRYSTGIGGGTRANSAPGSVTITGGTVNATGGERAAGIGCSNRSDGGNITITGGTVVARGGAKAAGIGGGENGHGGVVTISGGTVFAQSGGGSGEPAAIGGGGGTSSRGAAGNITISGGVVVAVEGIRSATPAPLNGTADIKINGGTIIAGGIGRGGAQDPVSFTGSPANAVALTSAVLDSGTYTGEFPANGALLVGSEVSISFTGTTGNAAAAGTVTLNTLFFIPEGATLRVPPGWTLVTNGYLVNNGEVIQSAGAAITGGVSGSVTVE